MKDLLVPRMIVYYTCPTAVHAEHVLGHGTPEPIPRNASLGALQPCSSELLFLKNHLSVLGNVELVDRSGGEAGEKSAD